MSAREEAQALARRLHAFSDHAEIMRKAAARELAARHPVDATELIHHLLELSSRGSEPARCALRAITAALSLEAAGLPEASELRRMAQTQSLAGVAALFAQGPARKEMDADAAARADARAFTESLGHLKQKARSTRDPDQLSRLAMATNPSVVRNALLNPRLTEDLVVRIAARQPARPEPLLEIWRSPRWSARPGVRRALVFNPYLPPEIGAKIVPLLAAPELQELARTESLHPALREQARLLLKERGGEGTSVRRGGSGRPSRSPPASEG
jgi:hypothetical protein